MPALGDALVKGCDPSVVMYYASAAVAKGQPGDAFEKVEEIRKAHARDVSALRARWLLAAVVGDWDRVAQTEKLLEPLQSPGMSWWLTTKRMRIKHDDSLDARIDGAMKAKELQTLAPDMRIQRSIESGRFADGADLIAINAKDLDPAGAAMLEAYAAGGFMLQHDSASALKLLNDAHKLVAGAPKGSGQRVTTALVEGLRGTMPIDTVMAIARENDSMPHAWFVDAIRAAGSGDKKHASESLGKCMRAASDLDFPYLEGKAMAARLE